MGNCYIAGVWDLFHVGHLRAIQRAKELAGARTLIVGVVTDEHAYAYKHEWPAVPYEQRSEIVRSLRSVDVVVPQTVQFDIGHMRTLGVTTVYLGDDWQRRMPDHLRGMMAEIEVIFLPRTQDVSTTDLRERICGMRNR